MHPSARCPEPDVGTASLDAAFVDRVRLRLASEIGPDGPSVGRLADAVRDEVGLHGEDVVRAALGVVRRELSGAGPLGTLLADPDVTDVLVNGPKEVWIDRGFGLTKAPVQFADDEAVRRLAVRLVAAGGRRLDAAAPCADATLPDGTRLHAVLAPIARTGTCLSLRTLRRTSVGLADLAALGMMDEPTLEVLRAVIAARLSLVISGGTGCGKTTLLGALLSGCSAAQRLILVEDVAELAPDHPHAVALQTRPPNIEGSGAIELRSLVRQALRMRPDRLIIGEVRGAEVLDLLAALNTGHDGSATTVHANSAGDVVARLEALASMGGVGTDALHTQAGAALQLVVQLTRDRAGYRRVCEIATLATSPAGRLRVIPALQCRPAAEPPERPWAARVAAGEGVQRLRDWLVHAGVDPPPILASASATARSP